VVQFISDSTIDHHNQTIISALVDEGLTPIIQVPDVAELFKQKLKEKYYKHQLEQHVELGKKVRISREKVVDFILDSIDDINEEITKNFSMQDTFKCCGLNSWSSSNSLNAFKEHRLIINNRFNPFNFFNYYYFTLNTYLSLQCLFFTPSIFIVLFAFTGTFTTHGFFNSFKHLWSQDMIMAMKELIIIFGVVENTKQMAIAGGIVSAAGRFSTIFMRRSWTSPWTS
jgi:hypothetical protein